MINWFKKAFYLIVLIGFSASHAGSYEDFFTAIQRDNAWDVQTLLDKGFDPNTVGPKGVPALLVAIAAEAWEATKTIAANPATNVNLRNANDESPLMLAALKGQLEICKRLIRRGADINKPGWAPLHYAVTKGDTDIIQLLLDQYAYIDAESPNGSTPLMMAAMYGTESSVQLLLEAGADPTIKNAIGLTALDFATRANKPEAVALIAAAIRRNKPQGDW